MTRVPKRHLLLKLVGVRATQLAELHELIKDQECRRGPSDPTLLVLQTARYDKEYHSYTIELEVTVETQNSGDLGGDQRKVERRLFHRIFDTLDIFPA